MVWTALSPACVEPPVVAGRPCPCGDGYVCCEPCGGCLPAARGCGDDRELEIGLGDADRRAFAPLPADGALPLAQGFQLGYHALVQLRFAAGSIVPEDLRLARRLIDPADGCAEVGAQLQAHVRLVAAGGPDGGGDDRRDGPWLLGDEQLLFVCPRGTPGPALHDRALLLAVEAASAHDPGRVLRQRAIVRPRCPAGDDFCRGNGERGCAGR